MQAAQRFFARVKLRFLTEFRTLKGVYLRHKFLSIPLTVAIFCGFVLTILIILLKPVASETPKFKIEALKRDSAGVDTLSEFRLVSQKPIEGSQIKSLLKITPAEKYDLKKVADTEYKIKFAKELSKDKIYKFEITDVNNSTQKTNQSWAFQIKGTFRIIQTLPKNEATYVPLNSGIEFVFSNENFKSDGIEKYIEINPKLDGRFEKHNRTLVFVPKTLKPRTLYTVTVKKGIPLEGSSEVLGENKVFQFETEAEKNYSNQSPFFSSETYEFPSSEIPVLEGWGEVQPEQAAVYKIDEATFVKSLQERDGAVPWTYYQSKAYATEKLPTYLTFTPTIKSTKYAKYIELPKKLENGFYLIETTIQGKKDQAWLQITPVSAYTAVSRTKTLFWVNSVETKKPIEGASVELIGGGLNAATNKDGIAGSLTPDSLKNNKAHYFKIKSGNSILIIRAFSYSYSPNSDLYWHYFYLDRGLFRTTDSVSFWGVLKKREGDQPKKVKIKLTENSYVDYFYNKVDIISKEVDLSDSNTFIGFLDFKDLKPGNYEVTLLVGDETIDSKSIEVGIFDKPAYQIRVNPSKKAFFVGEDISYQIKTEFFEGTPAPNISLKVSGNETNIIKTNSNGETSFTTKAKLNYATSNNEVNGIYLTPAEAELADISAGAYVKVFKSAINIDAEGKTAGGKATIEGSIKSVDPTKVKDIYSNNGFLSAGVSTDLKASIFETRQVARETGEYYDFIEKKTFKTYDYSQVRIWYKNLEAKSDKDGKFNLQFDIDTQKEYEVRITANDSSGRESFTTVYVSRSVDTTSPTQYYLENTKDYPALYKIGENVELTLKKDREQIKPDTDTRFLYVQSQNGIRDYSLLSSPTYSFKFEEKHIPNVYVTGVMFNGFTYKASSNPTYWPGSGTLVQFDKSEKDLKIEIKTAKQKYSPGEPAKLDITVRDNNNKPVSAEVNLNIIDESLYAVSQEASYLDPLSDFYRNVSAGIYSSYLSHHYPSEIYQGGGGGGGGERTDFRDKVYFGSVKTGQDGKGSVTVKLPDNLTTWRVSVQGFTSNNLQIGKGGGSIVVSKDLFVEASIPSELLVADKPEIKLRAFGSSLKNGDKVEFGIKAETLGWKDEKKFNGKAFEATYIKMPDLKEGSHKITFSVKASNSKDAVVKEIQVLSGRAKVGKIIEYSVSPELKLNANGSARSTLTFVNESLGVAYPILRRQTWSSSDRLEAKIAKKIAADLLKNYYYLH